MIKTIYGLAQNCVSLNILARVNEGGTLSLSFHPTMKPGGDPALAQPFLVSGTPDELEKSLPELLEKVRLERATLAEQVEATTAVLQMATKASADKATTSLKGGKPGKATVKQTSGPAVGTDSDEDEDEETGEADSGGEAAVASGAETATAPAAKTAGALNLFD